jgi:hypothetical protein
MINVVVLNVLFLSNGGGASDIAFASMDNKFISLCDPGKDPNSKSSEPIRTFSLYKELLLARFPRILLLLEEFGMRDW